MKWSKSQIVSLLEKSVEAGVNFELTDEQIADFFEIKNQPHSDIGILLKKKMMKAIEENSNKQAPYRIKVFEKQWPESKVEVFLFNDNALLCGKDALDSIYVFKGNLFSIPPSSQEYKNVLKEGVKIFSFAELFASLAAFKFESMHSDYEVVEMNEANSLEQANVSAPLFLKKWLEKNHKETQLNAKIKCKVEIKIKEE